MEWLLTGPALAMLLAAAEVLPAGEFVVAMARTMANVKLQWARREGRREFFYGD